MRLNRSLFSRVALFLLAGLVGIAGGCAGMRAKKPAFTDVDFRLEDWTYAGANGEKITTPHYEIYTTLTDPVLVEALPQALETAYAFYHELVPGATEVEQPMKVYLFARRGEWANFTRRFGPRRSSVLLKVRRGGYMERGITVAEYVSHAVTYPLLTHEGFHQFLYHCGYPRVPAWLNEGLAVYCEGQRWTAGGLAEFDPWHNPQRRNALAELILRDELFSLDDLLSINAGSVVGGSNRKIGAYYGQVWALTLFLREGADGKYAEGFQRLLEALGSRDLEQYARAGFLKSERKSYNFGRDLFRCFIAEDVDAVELEYREFMRENFLGSRADKRGWR